MKILDLDELGFGLKSHLSALWWLGLLYRRPRLVKDRLNTYARRSAIIKGLVLYWHALPYSILLIIAGRMLIFGVLVLESVVGANSSFDINSINSEIGFGIAVGIATGIASSFTAGIAVHSAVSIVFSITLGITFGITFNIASGITLGIASGIASSITGGITSGIAFGIAFSITERITDRNSDRNNFDIARLLAYGIVGSTAGYMLKDKPSVIIILIATGTAIVLTTLVTQARLYYYPIHLLLTWPKARLRWFKYHPAIWDEMSRVPYKGLHRLLVDKAMIDPAEGNRCIDYLIEYYPAQRMEALTAKTILGIRRMAEVVRLGELGTLAGRLPEGDKEFFVHTSSIRQSIEEISREQIKLDTIDRPAFREIYGALVKEKVTSFYERVNGYPEPFRSEYRAAAKSWLEIADRQLEEARRVTSKSLITQVFRAGDPVDKGQEAFILRNSVTDNIVQQALMAKGCPGIILYARRRIGKSTLLKNLSGFLPTNFSSIVFSMQNPDYFTSLSLWTTSLSEQIQRQVPLDLESPSDLPAFFGLLDKCNKKLEADGQRLILGIDEYEGIDLKIGEGIFNKDLLSTLRESIQTHRHITWIFAGSHHISELENADWTSYLISARTIEIPLFTPAETHLLLTEPLQYSGIDKSQIKHFEPGFWGPGGVDRIHSEAAGWPHLVQLIAETTIDILNSESVAESVTAEILDRAIERSVVSGDTVLHQLLKRESRQTGEWDYLIGFKKLDVQPPPQDDNVAQSLRRRMIVLEEEAGWRLRVPLMLRWLRTRA